jgi:hypothetical protein
MNKSILIKYKLTTLKGAGLTKPDEVSEILSLYRLKSLSLDYQYQFAEVCSDTFVSTN